MRKAATAPCAHRQDCGEAEQSVRRITPAQPQYDDEEAEDHDCHAHDRRAQRVQEEVAERMVAQRRLRSGEDRSHVAGGGASFTCTRSAI